MTFMASIFKSYDVRGLYPEEINEDIVERIGRAYVAYVKAKRVVVASDKRSSSPSLSRHFRRREKWISHPARAPPHARRDPRALRRRSLRVVFARTHTAGQPIVDGGPWVQVAPASADVRGAFAALAPKFSGAGQDRGQQQQILLGETVQPVYQGGQPGTGVNLDCFHFDPLLPVRLPPGCWRCAGSEGMVGIDNRSVYFSTPICRRRSR